MILSPDSAATLLNKVILEGDSSKADIVLGLDMNLFDLADKSELFTTHINNINSILKLPLSVFLTNLFHIILLFSLCIMSKFRITPKSMYELINSTNARIVIQDPRTSTPGLDY